MILKSIHTAAYLLRNVIDKQNENLTKPFTTHCETIVNELSPDNFICQATIVNGAIALAEYFNLNKLLLSSYNVDPTDSFTKAFNKIKDNQFTVQISNKFSSLDPKMISYMKKVIMYKASIITPIMISNGNLRKQQIAQVWNKL